MLQPCGCKFFTKYTSQLLHLALDDLRPEHDTTLAKSIKKIDQNYLWEPMSGLTGTSRTWPLACLLSSSFMPNFIPTSC